MSTHDTWPHNITDGWTDISAAQDGSRLIRPVRHGDAPYGWLEAHRNRHGAWCTGILPRRAVEQSRPSWEVVVEDPLTLEPSVKCGTCGNHGWIRGGRWEAA